MYEAFVYIWKNITTGKRYIGVHKGTVDDGYICSSNSMMEDYSQDIFVRQIMAVFKDYNEARDWEANLCNKIDAAANPMFYNMHNGNNKTYFKKGYTPWNKGKSTGPKSDTSQMGRYKRTTTNKKNTSKRMKNNTNGFPKGYVPWNKGKKTGLAWNRGLTKETDPRVASNYIKRPQNY
jgi:hypothetical protein